VQVLRSVLFNVLFYLNLFLHVVVAIPTYALPRRAFMAVAKSWGRTSNALMRVAGIKVELRGLEKIPRGSLIVAAKHQSVWETFTLLTLFDDPAYIFKRELGWIPIFGWYAVKSRMVPVDRKARGGAIAGMVERRGGTSARPSGHHLSRRHAHRAGRPTVLQERRRASLRCGRRAVPAGCAQLGFVLAAPKVFAPPRHDYSRSARPDPARARPRRIRGAVGARDRDRAEEVGGEALAPCRR
jgi:hypothetical protein